MPNPASNEEIQNIVTYITDIGNEKKQNAFNLPVKDLYPYLNLSAGEDPCSRLRIIIGPKLANMNISIVVMDTIANIKFPSGFIETKKTRRGTIKAPKNIENETAFKQTVFKTSYVYPKEFVFVKQAVEMGHYPYLKGEPSTGKTRMAEEIAHALQLKVYRLSADAVPDADFLIGYERLLKDEGERANYMKFVPGPLTEAIINGWMVIIDEIDRASSECIRALNMITEDGGSLVVSTEAGVKTFSKHPNFRLVFTGNTFGRGDETGAFTGVEMLNKAWLSRIGPKVEINRNMKVEKSIMSEYLPKGILEDFYDEGNSEDSVSKDGLVKKIINLFGDDQTEFLTLRSLLRFAEALPVMGWHAAFYIYVMNEFDKGSHPRIIEALGKFYGTNSSMTPTFDIEEIEKIRRSVKNNQSHYKKYIDKGYYCDLFPFTAESE